MAAPKLEVCCWKFTQFHPSDLFVMAGASHLTLDSSLTYGHSGVPLHGIQFYLKDWEEGGYFANDKPNPRGEIVIGSHTISQGGL